MADPNEQKQEGEPTKRRRRSGWDTPLAGPAPLQIPGIQMAQNVAFQTPDLLSQQLSIQRSQQLLAQQALQQSLLAASVIPVAPASNPLDRRIYVGSLHYDIKEEDIRALFSCFGTIAKVDMSHDSVTGRSKGFAFVEFTDVQSAAAAQAMDGFELANRKIKVGRPQGGAGGGLNSAPVASAAAQQAALLALSTTGLGTATFPAGLGLNIGLPGVAMPGIGVGVGLAGYGMGVGMVPGGPISPMAGVAAGMSVLSAKEQAQLLLSQALGQPIPPAAGAVGAPQLSIPALAAAAGGSVVAATGGSAAAPVLQVPASSSSSAKSKTIILSNLHPGVTAEQLRGIFVSFGNILTCQIKAAAVAAATPDDAAAGEESDASKNDPAENKSTELKPNEASIEYSTPDEAALALAGMDGFSFMELPLKVKFAPAPAVAAPAAAAPTHCSVLLEDMVTAAEAREPDFTEEVSDEAANYGTLKSIEVKIGDPPEEKVKVILRYGDPLHAAKAHRAMDGRYFGGQPIRATLVQ